MIMGSSLLSGDCFAERGAANVLESDELRGELHDEVHIENAKARLGRRAFKIVTGLAATVGRLNNSDPSRYAL